MPRELIPIIFFMMAGIVGLAFSPIGQAIARRLGGSKADANEVEELRGEISDLRAELDDMRGRVGQMDELQGRLDFAERMIAQSRAQGALPKPEDSHAR